MLSRRALAELFTGFVVVTVAAGWCAYFAARPHTYTPSSDPADLGRIVVEGVNKTADATAVTLTAPIKLGKVTITDDGWTAVVRATIYYEIPYSQATGVVNSDFVLKYGWHVDHACNRDSDTRGCWPDGIKPK